MKKIFALIVVFLFFYVNIGHNSVLAYCILDHTNNDQTSHQIHNDIEEHKCCFAVNSGNDTIIGNYYFSGLEKVKLKKLFSISIDFKREIFSVLKENTQNKPPTFFYESQKSFYITLIGTVKSII